VHRENFSIVQALRGLAALWVVLFHLEKTGAITGLTKELPAALDYAVFGYGSAGVAVFFVLSGFVIAHSLNGRDMTAAELGRFALRRSVRLDPPYWASMALVTTVGAALAFAHHAQPMIPSAPQILAHVTYTQELLGVPEIEVVYWTLTYEIQFYLVFAAALWIGRKEVLAGLFLLALWSAFQGHEWALHGLFVYLWQGFVLGVLAYRCGYHREPGWPLFLLAAVTIAFQKGGVFATPCAVTAVLLFVAARRGWLSTLSGNAWQGLGAISYSLYLVHIPTLHLLSGAWQRVAGRGTVPDMLGAVVLTGSCLIAAAIFWRAAEYPSHRLAKRLFRPPLVPAQL
jgi:peptidoglycan/LPS O-acetylase OafA/YrhL